MATPRERAGALAVAAGVVSALFLAPPSPALLEVLAEGDGWPLPDDASTSALASAAAWLRRRGPEVARTLRQDHFELFVGPGRGFACPYESVWTSPENMMFDEQTYAVRDAFARLGLSAPLPEQEPDDHIGLEVAFVAEIAQRLESWDEDQHADLRQLLVDFLVDHLDRFAPNVLAGVEEHAATPVYAALPALARGVLREAHALASHGADTAPAS